MSRSYPLPWSWTKQIAYVRVSARTGEGLAELAQAIAAALNEDHEPTSADNPVLTRERHRVALGNARGEIVAFLQTV